MYSQNHTGISPSADTLNILTKKVREIPYAMKRRYRVFTRIQYAGNNVLKHCFVFFFAGVASVFLFFKGPHIARQLEHIMFSATYFDIPLWILHVLYAYYFLFILGSIFPFLLLCGWFLMRSRAQAPDSNDVPFVSVIIPAFNEESCISKCIEAAANLDYPSYEVIVIDDGSEDFTLPLLENSPISFTKLRHNRGKFAALNEGMRRAKGEIIVFSDSDSWLHPQALRYLVKYFSNAKVGAVAGTVMLDKPFSLIRCWQMLEYIFGQAFVKIAQVGSGSSVTICPGPIGAYRKELLLKGGGFKERTLTEDFDATLDIIQQGYRVCYEPKAIAFTDSPVSWNGLMRQRLRWLRGNLQVLKVHKNILFSPAAGLTGFFWLPFYFLIISYGLGVLEMLMIASVPFLAFFSGSPVLFFKTAAIYFCFIELLNIFQYSLGLVLAKQVRASFIISAISIMPYRLFLNWVKLRAVFREVQRKELKWSEI